MVRILGNNLSVRKKVYIALTAIYGIGIPTALRMLKEINIDPETKVSDLTVLCKLSQQISIYRYSHFRHWYIQF